MEVKQLDMQEIVSCFLFDWDDTLFPTSALLAEGAERLGSSMEMIDSLVVQLLETALAVPRSRVVLLTNASMDWVWYSAGEFLPGVNMLLQDERLTLISANQPRDTLPEVGSAAYCAAVRSWKRNAVRPLATSVRQMITNLDATRFQVLSVGDSLHDLEAAHHLSAMTLQLERDSNLGATVKTVQMKPAPSSQELAGQLRTLSKALLPLARSPRSLHQNMCRTDQLQLPATPAVSAGDNYAPFAAAQSKASRANVTSVRAVPVASQEASESSSSDDNLSPRSLPAVEQEEDHQEVNEAQAALHSTPSAAAADASFQAVELLAASTEPVEEQHRPPTIPAVSSQGESWEQHWPTCSAAANARDFTTKGVTSSWAASASSPHQSRRSVARHSRARGGGGGAWCQRGRV
jgi:hypothetical protein